MSLPEWCQTHSLKEFMELIDQPIKEKNMTEHVNQDNTGFFQTKETVTTTGYVDKDGKFVPVDEARVLDEVHTQDAEDVIVD